ncbi:MAG TPA: hypothetical protein ENK08_11515 [Chloroflexi bacterium]|nr:hypothetical protein [Chloroflexota bacterium]
MIRRNTQDPAYWEDFQVTDEDLDYLANLLVEREVPLPLDELARELVAFRCRREEERITRELSKGTLYLPKNRYEVGETLVFPALEYAVGEVTGVREGRNPEYGTFRVIQVRFPNGETREFASELADHPLNEMQQAQEEEEGLLSPEELYAAYGDRVREVLNARLEAAPTFIRLAGQWFVKDLLAEIHEGHLNLAEAVLDMAGGGPLPTEALIDHLDLPKEINRQLGIFSLNYALQEDERFDEVGPAGEVLWYLRRLEPSEVLDPPVWLTPAVVEYDHRLLDESMLDLERQLDDEWSELIAPPEVEEPVTIVLICPHRRAGTLPLSSRLSRVFPTGRTHRIRFTFRDADTGEEMEGWVVRERRYVYGLKEWYERYDVPIGAYLEISRGPEPGVILIRRQAQRTRREWVRIGTVLDGRLTFEMGRYPISCKMDELMGIAVEDLQSLDEIGEQLRRERVPLEEVVAEVFPELAKLSPQGMVHASTLYSAVNLVMRVPPGPILATLVRDDRFVAIGDNYWRARG